MPIILIYIIACLEGFTTLAIQMIILRLAIPITGSSIVVTSIFLGIILLALSFGYWWGGKIAEKSKVESIKSKETDEDCFASLAMTKVLSNDQGVKRLPTILGRYLIISGLRYLVLVIPYQREILQFFMQEMSYELALFAVAMLLFFVPIFLASQTVPILIELIPVQSKGRSAGLIFFISTIGSFLGSVCTTLYMFPEFGVYRTGVVVSGVLILLGCLVRMTNQKKGRKEAKVSKAKTIQGGIMIFVVSLLMYMIFQHRSYGADIIHSYDSSYQEILVRNFQREGKPVRIFHTNRSFASGFDPAVKQSPFEYIRHMVDMTKILQPKRVLVIGAAGFVYPYEIAKFDFIERIDAIDIDPKVKDIAEQYLLQESLSPKIHFIPESARYAVRRLAEEEKRYDLIIVDAFMGRSVPAELVTQEFMKDILALTPSKQVLRNMILDNSMESVFAQQFLATAQSVFEAIYSYDVLKDQDRPRGSTTNMILSSIKNPLYGREDSVFAGNIYTDDRNSAEVDSIAVLNN